jgi:stage V sporulation protein S
MSESEEKIHDDSGRKKEHSKILRVKGDPPDVSAEERKRNVKNLAGAIAHGLRQYGEVYVRCFSHSTMGKASKAMAIARGFVAVQGFDLYCAPAFIKADFGTQERTGICYWVFTNKTDIEAGGELSSD